MMIITSKANAILSLDLHSALKDTRFSPITLAELPRLRCSVSILVSFEPAADCFDWEVGVHGIRIAVMEGASRRSGTYLPDVAKEQGWYLNSLLVMMMICLSTHHNRSVAAGWTKEEAVDSLLRKARFSGPITAAVRAGIQTTRYQSSKTRLTYSDWKH